MRRINLQPKTMHSQRLTQGRGEQAGQAGVVGDVADKALYLPILIGCF